MKYICTICGYIYDDSKENIPFDSLPDDWKCPLCGASKSDFKLMEEENKYKKYECEICGYIYDEKLEDVPFDSLPDDWKCPLCGASKSDFKLVEEEFKLDIHEKIDEDLVKLNVGEMGAILSNLARGCEKQGLSKQKDLFNDLAKYFDDIRPIENNKKVEDLLELLNKDALEYETLKDYCLSYDDRGAARVSVWGQRVNKMLISIINRYLEEGNKILENTNIWVCSICGFVYIGDNPPELCPVCKVPSNKFEKMEGLR